MVAAGTRRAARVFPQRDRGWAAQRTVDHEFYELVFRLHVMVQRHRGDAEFGRDAAHRDGRVRTMPKMDHFGPEKHPRSVADATIEFLA
jgi:hypothetical protein